MSASDQEGLRGVWDGLFSYPRLYKPTSFTTVLFETGTAISGTIHEVATGGKAAGQDVTASFSGVRDGRAVRFLKVYETQGAHHRRPVAYDGHLNADATEIEGTWSIVGNWSGKFLMIRSCRPPQMVEERREQLAPVD